VSRSWAGRRCPRGARWRCRTVSRSQRGHHELGKHCQAARQRPVAQLKATATDRCWLLATAVNRCLGHVEGHGRRGRTWLEPGGDGSQLADE